MNTKLKKYYFSFSSIQIILTISIFILNYIKYSKMGIVRHITFWNNYKFPNLFTRYNIYICIILLTIMLLIFIIKKAIKSPLLKMELLISILILLIFIIFTFVYNVETQFIYYYIIIYFILFNLLQLLKLYFINHFNKFSQN